MQALEEKRKPDIVIANLKDTGAINSSVVALNSIRSSFHFQEKGVIDATIEFRRCSLVRGENGLF